MLLLEGYISDFTCPRYYFLYIEFSDFYVNQSLAGQTLPTTNFRRIFLETFFFKIANHRYKSYVNIFFFSNVLPVERLKKIGKK
jgi:hypothetical protein